MNFGFSFSAATVALIMNGRNVSFEPSFSKFGFSLATTLYRFVALIRSMWTALGIAAEISMFLAMAFRVCDIGTRSTSSLCCSSSTSENFGIGLGCWGFAALLISASSTLPSGPVPATLDMSIPISLASFLTAGVAMSSRVAVGAMTTRVTGVGASFVSCFGAACALAALTSSDVPMNAIVSPR